MVEWQLGDCCGVNGEHGEVLKVRLFSSFGDSSTGISSFSRPTPALMAISQMLAALKRTSFSAAFNGLSNARWNAVGLRQRP